jgi:hypothetical protein
VKLDRVSHETALRIALGVVVAGAGVIHMAMVPMHAEHRPSMAVFLLGGVAQLGAAVALFAAPMRLAALGAAAVSGGGIALWALTRTTGVPFLPGFQTRQPVEAADLAATLLEIGAVALAAMLVAAHSWAKRVSLPPALARHTISAVGAASILVVGAALTVPSDHDSHSHGAGGGHAHPASARHAHAAGEEPAGAHVHADASDVVDASGHVHTASAHAQVMGAHHGHGGVVTQHGAEEIPHRHEHETQATGHEHSGAEEGHTHGSDDGHHHPSPGATADDPHNIRGTCDPSHPYIADMLRRLKAFQKKVPDMASALAGGWVPLGPVPNDFGYPDTYWHWIDWFNPPPGPSRDEIVRPDDPQYLLLVPAWEYDKHPDTMLWAVEGFMFAKAEPGRGPELYPGCNPFHTHSAEAGGFRGSLNEHFHVWPWHHIHPFAMNPPHLCTEDGKPRESPYPFRNSWGCMS